MSARRRCTEVVPRYYRIPRTASGSQIRCELLLPQEFTELNEQIVILAFALLGRIHCCHSSSVIGRLQSEKGRCTTMAQSWDDYLAYQEKVDGIQFTWNILPHSRDDAIKIPVPIGVFYQPLKERPLDQPQQPVLNYEPVLCQKKTCKAVLNPLCFVDYQGKSWKCNICQQRNMFPPHYAVIAEDRRPPELYPQFATIEYTLRNPKADILAPIFVFVLDTCVPEDELKALKESIQTAVSLLPADSLVSLVTYGKMVELHELTARDMPISHVFNGAKEVRREQMENKLRESIGKPAGIGPQEDW
ncbi:hypothetical protein QR680_007811 [Steinernema hermaphroditum]|uniref:Protein transport protein SEC23 n=1 Tax=Steinernema hermaphroditum TaxID=289476 RepID=A0AA39IGS9_9BILA|nr:hypothetical protein QR680_007811 [Steinernema hermaphroditum]